MKRQGLRRFVTTGLVATSLLASTAALSANDMFLKMDGIQGESQDAKHKGEIDVLSWSWGESTGAARTRRGTEPATCIQDLNLTKYVDSSSPALIMNGMLGDVVPTAVLVVRKSGQEQQEFLKLTMKNVTVVSFQTGGAQGGDNLMESVTLHFETMEGEYRKQKPDGSLEAPIKWDIAGGNAACR